MQLISKKIFAHSNSLPEKILQFGTGILLRGLPDYFIDKANKQGIFNGKIVVIKSTAGGADDFEAQDGLFTTCIRGLQNGQQIQENVVNESISRVISANDNWEEVLKIAQSKEIEVIISNTTEVGIQYVAESIFATPPQSFPAKLAAILYERFKTSQKDGLVIVPTELIPNNGTKLKEIVLQLIDFNKLGEDFKTWFLAKNIFCNSLVDRIVTNATLETKASLGYEDNLAIQTEPYCLWAIEGGEKVREILSFEQVDSGVIIEENIDYYRERKLRLLNGTHTISVCKGFLKGLNTVYECMQDVEMQAFIKNVMLDEIMPTVLAQSYPIPVSKEELERYAHEILDRFRNPNIVHYLINITLQATSKMKMRNIPTILRYRELFGKNPTLILEGFTSYLLFMHVVKEENGEYFGKRGNEFYPIQDDFAPYFAQTTKNINFQNTDEVTQYLNEMYRDTTLWDTALSANHTNFDFEQALLLIESEIKNTDFGANPPELYEPIRYLMDLGGKRIRPLLVLIGNYLFADNWRDNAKSALSVEVFHNFTLMHDDIMDNAPIRRGKPTVHEKWNRNIALLSGDVMLVKAYQQLDFVTDSYFKTVLNKFHQCAAEVCEGQQYDMNFEQRTTVSEQEYINMIRLKTAVLLGFSLEFGAIIGGASVENAQKLYDFGVNIGIGFQLKDDLLDVYSEQEKFGKQVGGDIIANKKTFLLIKALERAEGSIKNELGKWLNASNFDKTEKVNAVIEIYNTLKIKEITEAKMNTYFDAAFSILNEVGAIPDRKDVLIKFTTDLLNREK